MISLLIKPASGACNLKCQYCFYNDVSENRSIKNMGEMSEQMLELLVEKSLNEATDGVAFSFQGGEPTLVGLDFYHKLILYEKKYNHKHLQIDNSIQTNGMLIDANWAVFFADNNFLVGLSLDGDKSIHEQYRGESFNQVMKAAQLFKKHGVEYNVLCVVTSNTVRHAQRIYNFYKKNGFRFLQFIPCLDKLNQQRGKNLYSITAEQYGTFMCNLFDFWYDDYMHGKYVSIRDFDNYVRMLMGYPPESCSMGGICQCYFVIEANGSVYPCDFYVLDEYCIGKIDGNDTFSSMAHSSCAIEFIRKSTKIPKKCELCTYFSICRNGCRRNRVNDVNYLCEGYQQFFEHTLGRLQKIASEQLLSAKYR